MKFHTSFITVFFPFANLSESSVLYSTGKEVHVSICKPKERALGVLEIGKSLSPSLS